MDALLDVNRWVAWAAFKGLELYDGKLSRTVLMGRRAGRPLATRWLTASQPIARFSGVMSNGNDYSFIW